MELEERDEDYGVGEGRGIAAWQIALAAVVVIAVAGFFVYRAVSDYRGRVGPGQAMAPDNPALRMAEVPMGSRTSFASIMMDPPAGVLVHKWFAGTPESNEFMGQRLFGRTPKAAFRQSISTAGNDASVTYFEMDTEEDAAKGAERARQAGAMFTPPEARAFGKYVVTIRSGNGSAAEFAKLIFPAIEAKLKH